jgi:hypothetical protein
LGEHAAAALSELRLALSCRQAMLEGRLAGAVQEQEAADVQVEQARSAAERTQAAAQLAEDQAQALTMAAAELCEAGTATAIGGAANPEAALAAEEQRLTILQGEVTRRESCAAAVCAAHTMLSRAQANAAVATAALARCAERRSHLDRALQSAAAEASGDTAALQAQLDDLAQRAAEARASTQRQREALAEEEQMLGQLRTQLLAEQQTAHEAAKRAAALAKGSGGGENSGGRGGLSTALADLQRAEAGMLRAQRAAAASRAEAAAKRATAAVAASGGAALPRLPHTMVPAHHLFECFWFKQPGDPGVRQLAPALGAACAGSLDVAIVADAQAAAVLLQAHRQLQQAGNGASGEGNATAAGRKLRVWPLGRLAAPDRRVQQREAQRALGPSRLNVPTDLLDYDPVYAPAVMRAFGGVVIAADDQAAGAAAAHFGLTAVTPAGDVHRKGSVSGGWTHAGGAGRGTSAFEAIMARDATAAAARAAEAAAACAAETHAVAAQHAAAARMAAEQQAVLDTAVAEAKAVVQALEGEVASVEARTERARAKVAQQEQDAADLWQAQAQCRALLAALQGAATNGNAGRGASYQLAQLKDALVVVRAQEAERAGRLENAEAEVRACWVGIE